MAMAWTWGEYWNWFEQLETDEQRKTAWLELNKDNWIARLSSDNQFQVFKDSPMSLKSNMKKLPHIFKHEAILLLQLDLDKKHKITKRRRTYIK